jgi:hypothetical protein
VYYYRTHVTINHRWVLIMSMYHNRPGHVYSLGQPFVVPLNRRRPACYDTRSYQQYHKEWIDGFIHLSRRDVAYTFNEIHRPDSYMGGLRLLTCVFSLINHSNVRFYLHHQRSTTTSELDKSVYHYSSPSASTPSQRRRPDYVYSERADCL